LHVKIENYCVAVLHPQTPLKLTLAGHGMTDLILQGLRELFGKNLVQFLSSEKRKMLGERSVPTKQTAVNCFRITGFSRRAKKDRAAR
jgi:hypothetical protein